MSKLFYVGAGLATFLGFLLVMAPASLMTSMVEDSLKQEIPDLQVGRVEGRIWHGSAELQYRQFPALVSWQLAALPLLAGRVSADVDVASDGLEASFHVSADNNQSAISSAQALVDASYINQVSVDFGLDLSGEFSLSETDLSFNERQITSATGKLDWPGGMVHIETPQQIHSVVLPPLNGNLSKAGDNLHLAINGSQEKMLDLTLKPSGWVEVAVSFAFIELAGLPIPGNINVNSAEPAVLLEEKIL